MTDGVETAQDLLVPGRSSAVVAPRRADVAQLLLGVAAVSLAGPLVAASSVDGLAMAFWRLALAALLLVGYAAVRFRTRLWEELTSGGRLPVVAGALMGLHFALWIPSLSLTSVASSTALVTTQPVWTALLARAAGSDIPRRAWAGMGLALVGVVVITGFDATVSLRALSGDGLALLAAVAIAACTTVTGRARQTMSTAAFTAASYTCATGVLLVACLVFGADLSGYSHHDWWLVAAMALGPQLLGHSVFSRVVKTTSPTVVSLFILLEVPGAILLALVWLHQVPAATTLPGIALVLLGIAVVISRRGGSGQEAPAAP